MESILRKTFKVTKTGVNNLTDIDFVDDTPYYSLGVNPTNVFGNLKVTNPAGLVLHENTDFNSPDMDNANGFAFSIGPIPEDGDTDLPISGEYIAEHSVKLSSEVENISYEPIPVNSNIIRISNEYEIVGTTLQIEYVVPGTIVNSNVGLYNILSVSTVVPGYQDIVLEDTQSGTTIIGPNTNTTVTLTALTTETHIHKFNFDFKLPSLGLTLESECDLGVLKVTDDTLFVYNTISDVREVTLKYPENTEDEKPDIVFSNAYQVVDDLYTGTWNCVLKHTVVFVLDVVENTFVDIVLVRAKSHVVGCSESLCAYTECFSNLLLRVDDAACNSSAAEHARLVARTNGITSHILLAQLLKTCGITGYREVLAEISDMFASAGISGCGCEPDDGVSRKVMPIASLLPGGSQIVINSPDGSISVSFAGDTYSLAVSQQTIDALQGEDGSVIYAQSSAPTVALGQPGDVVFQSNGNVWKKSEEGVWQLSFNLLSTIQIPSIPESSRVFWLDEIPTDTLGENGDMAIVKVNRKPVYFKEADTWTEVGEMDDLYRRTQDNATQEPLLPNLTGEYAILYYVTGKDVFVNTTGGNTYVVNMIARVGSSGPVAPLDGEEFRVVNVGTENITFNMDYTILTSGLNVAPLMYTAASIVLPPKGSVLFRYVDSAAGLSPKKYYVIGLTV